MNHPARTIPPETDGPQASADPLNEIYARQAERNPEWRGADKPGTEGSYNLGYAAMAVGLALMAVAAVVVG